MTASKPKKPKITSEDILKDCPESIQKVAFKKFVLDGERIIIKVRVKDLHKKNVLYLFNLSTNEYLSSLFPLTDGSFYFDLRENELSMARQFKLKLENEEIIINEVKQ